MKNERPERYRQILARQFRNNRIAMAGFVVVVTLFGIGAGADFIANDKPLVMRYQGRIYFPVVKDYAVWLRISRWDRQFQNVGFKEFARGNFKQGDWAQFPPVPYSPTEVNLSEPLRRPSERHFFGTDDIGRDVASRIVHGARVSLSVGFVAVSIYALIGLFIGAIAGYYGGVLDIIASRLIEIMLTIPTFFLIITVVAVFVAATFGVASAILIESTLSFLGFGVPPSTASWGSILSNARQLLPSAWWLTAFPGLAIFLTVTSYNLVGEGLRDATDPRLRR